jgi:exonuclease III
MSTTQKLRVITWNVNGIASLFQYEPWRHQKSLKVIKSMYSLVDSLIENGSTYWIH